MESLNGSKLAGGNPSRGRVENDYYATPPIATKMLFDNFNVCETGKEFLEPCCGGGHIAETIKSYYGNDVKIDCFDLVDRGYPNTQIQDFLEYKPEKEWDVIVTNPPYSLAAEFVMKSMECLKDGGILAMFLKVQFLEGQGRKNLFTKYPPKYVYVFRKRIGPWRNGEEFDEKGKSWASTMCFAWFVWKKGNQNEPIIRWL